MTTLGQANAYTKNLLGNKTVRATSALPQTAQTSIFTVTGGKVLITAIIGTVTTAVQAQATTAQLVGNVTTGTDVNLTNATADLNGKEIGSTITPIATLGGTALVANAGGNALVAPLNFVVQTGSVDFKTGASSTGAVQWTCFWVPLDDGATVVAA